MRSSTTKIEALNKAIDGAYTNLEYITRWLLSFGNNVKVLEPETLIQHMENSAPKFDAY